MKGERRWIWNGLIFAFFLTVLAFVSVGCAADTYTVCSNGCDYTSIQAAVDGASGGDTIIVRNQTYYENVIVNKKLTLIGEDLPTIDSQGYRDAFKVVSNNCVIRGFRCTISGWYSGIKLESDGNLIENNTCDSGYISGIELWNSSDNIITNNTCKKNSVGIYSYYSSNNTIADNKIWDSTSCGIYLTEYSSNNCILSNEIINNDQDGIELHNCVNNIIQNNNIQEHYYNGIRICGSSNNVMANNTCGNTTQDGIGIFYSPNNTIFKNTLHDNGRGIRFVYNTSKNNTLCNNIIYDNYYGVFFDSSNNNLLYLNTFRDNTLNTFSHNSINTWNSVSPLIYNYNAGTFTNRLGNYWDDYDEKYPDSNEIDSKGVWNTPYKINGDSDYFPLVETFENYVIRSEVPPYTNVDMGVTSNITVADSTDLVAYLPPEYDGVDISDAVVLNVNVTDDTPANPSDAAYTDITINIGAMDIGTCKVFKSDLGFLPEVGDVTALPTVKPPGEPAFSRNVANNTVTVRLYVGDPLLAVLPPAALTFRLDLVTGLNLISMPINDASITTAASLAAKLGPNCTEVVTFNATQQQLQSYVPGVPLNNFAIVGAEGYFVNLNNPTPVSLTGTGWPSPFSVSLVSGLNLVGMPVNDTAVTTASTLATKIGASCQEVVNWESGTQSYVSYVTGVPLNDFAIRAGDGYFVTVDDQTEVTFEG